MKRVRSRQSSKAVQRAAMLKAMSTAVAKRASIFRNGSNQAVRLPQELRFAENVKEVRIRKQGGWTAAFTGQARLGVVLRTRSGCAGRFSGGPS